MAQVLVTNITSETVYLADAYVHVGPSETVTFERRPAEINLLTFVMDAVYAGQITVNIIYSAAEQAWLAGMSPPASPLLQRQLGAQDRDDVSFGAWPVIFPAELNSDSIITSLTVTRFDDTIEEGVGLGEYLVPTGAVNLVLTFEHRAQSPVAAVSVRPKLYMRKHAHNAAYGAATNTLLTALALPNSTAWQNTTLTITLASLGLAAGEIVQFELTRLGSDASDTLVGDWTLAMLALQFT